MQRKDKADRLPQSRRKRDSDQSFLPETPQNERGGGGRGGGGGGRAPRAGGPGRGEYCGGRAPHLAPYSTTPLFCRGPPANTRGAGTVLGGGRPAASSHAAPTWNNPSWRGARNCCNATWRSPRRQRKAPVPRPGKPSPAKYNVLHCSGTPGTCSSRALSSRV